MPKNDFKTIVLRSLFIALVLSVLIEMGRDLALQSYTELNPPMKAGELDKLSFMEAKGVINSRSIQISGLDYFMKHAGSSGYWKMKIIYKFSYLFFTSHRYTRWIFYSRSPETSVRIAIFL
ncbi:MAG: hypothetical protein HRT89_19235 [Lentisphaeria bacterium]|nr:hypothetical protein [Lentisphaeria bacterium]